MPAVGLEINPIQCVRALLVFRIHFHHHKYWFSPVYIVETSR